MFYSVIIPVFNRKKYICRCIDSVIGQTFSDFELIIVDDGSSDGTGKICDEYEEKYSNIKVVHQENGGASKARNTGLQKAEGIFAIFLDSDDYFPPDYLYRIKLAYETYGRKYTICTSFKVYTEDGIQYFQYSKAVDRSFLKSNGIFELMNSGLFNSVVNKVYDVSLIKEFGVHFPTNVSLGEDLIFNLRYLDKKEEFKFLVLNTNFYIVWGKEKKGSLERDWRADYFEIQQMLLKKKTGYVNKWKREKKIPRGGKNITDQWYYNSIKESVEYYIMHIRDMSLLQFLSTIFNITHSTGYAKCVHLFGRNKSIILGIIYKFVYSRLKEAYKRGIYRHERFFLK